MAETPIDLVIDAEELSPRKLWEILRDFLALLGEVDEELSPTGSRVLDWRIRALSYSSPATIGLLSRPLDEQPDIGPTLVPALITGIRMIELGEERPSAFNDIALEHIRSLARDTDEDITAIRVRSPIVQFPATVTRQAAAHVERVLPLGYSTGSIEGRLEALNIHGQPQFTVYDAVSGRPVRCYFPAEDLERVKQAVGRKLIVSGRLRRDPDGRPRQVRPVDFFDVIDEPPSEPRRDPAGAIEGVEDSVEYLRLIRGD